MDLILDRIRKVKAKSEKCKTKEVVSRRLTRHFLLLRFPG